MSNLWDLSHIQPGRADVVPGKTIPAMFWNAVALRGDQVWMRQKKLGIWKSWSWRQTSEAVRELAAGLQALGLEPGQTASILANTVVEWVLADVAVLSCGAVSNGIYPTDAASQVHYLCEDSATRVLFVEDDEQLDKALEVRQHLPRLKKIVVFDMEGLHELNDPEIGARIHLYPGQQVGVGPAMLPHGLGAFLDLDALGDQRGVPPAAVRRGRTGQGVHLIPLRY